MVAPLPSLRLTCHACHTQSRNALELEGAGELAGAPSYVEILNGGKADFSHLTSAQRRIRFKFMGTDSEKQEEQLEFDTEPLLGREELVEEFDEVPFSEGLRFELAQLRSWALEPQVWTYKSEPQISDLSNQAASEYFCAPVCEDDSIWSKAS